MEDYAIFPLLLFVLYGYTGIFANGNIKMGFYRAIQTRTAPHVDLEGMAQRSHHINIRGVIGTFPVRLSEGNAMAAAAIAVTGRKNRQKGLDEYD